MEMGAGDELVPPIGPEGAAELVPPTGPEAAAELVPPKTLEVTVGPAEVLNITLELVPP